MPPASKKKKKKKKKPKATTTTTTTTPAPPPPAMSIYYPPPMQYQPEQPATFENFYYTQENSNNNGYGNAQSSYNMPAMMKMMQQYAGSNDQVNQPESASGGGRGGGGGGDGAYDKGGNSNTFEFPKIPQIIIKVPAPIVNVPQPIVNVPAAIVNVSVPEIRIPAAQVTVPAPIVNVPTPIVNVPAANVSVNVPNITVPPAIVNVPKKLVLKKEFRIASPQSSTKSMRGGGYNQMADSEQIEFDDEEDDENYSSAGSSHRQDKTSVKQVSNQQAPDYGNEIYPPVRQPLPVTHYSSSRRKKPRSRPPSRPSDQQPDYNFQNQNMNQQSQPAHERSNSVHFDDPDSTPMQQENNSPPDFQLTPVQHHFSRSPPLQYQTSTSGQQRPTHKPSGRPRNFKPQSHHQQQREQYHQQQGSPPPQSSQFDDQVQQQHDYTDVPDQQSQQQDYDHQQQERPPDHSKSPSPSLTEKAIDFLRNNNFQPLSNSNLQGLQVMRDDKKQPNIIFEQTTSPVPEAVSFESDQTILDDRSLTDPNPHNHQQRNDGIVFEDIPAHEFTAVAESKVPSPDAMMYEDQRDSAVYSTPMHHMNQHHKSLSIPRQQSSALSSPQTSRSTMVNGRKSRNRRRKRVRIQSHSNEGSNSDATTSQNLDAGASRNEHAPAAAATSMPIQLTSF